MYENIKFGEPRNAREYYDYYYRNMRTLRSTNQPIPFYKDAGDKFEAAAITSIVDRDWPAAPTTRQKLENWRRQHLNPRYMMRGTGRLRAYFLDSMAYNWSKS